MIKLRDAGYCNIKLFLIFLVIYGHLIESEIARSTMLMLQYKAIYFVHMPLFCFMSGLFLKHESACRRQLLHVVPLYLICQATAVLLGGGKVHWQTPYWHLWYLFSYSIWLGLAWVWFRLGKGKGKFIILAGAVLLGVLVGHCPTVGRAYSLSRTIVFLPYFWAGLLLDPSIERKRLRRVGMMAFVLALVLIICFGGDISAEFLYHATPYENVKNGAVLRLFCYLIGGGLGLFVFALCPEKRYPFTRLGANTMSAYLLHAPIVLYLRGQALPWQIHVIVTIIFLYITDMLFKWFGDLYGIVPKEGKEG